MSTELLDQMKYFENFTEKMEAFVEEVKKNFVPHMTYEEYMNYLNG